MLHLKALCFLRKALTQIHHHNGATLHEDDSSISKKYNDCGIHATDIILIKIIIIIHNYYKNFIIIIINSCLTYQWYLQQAA